MVMAQHIAYFVRQEPLPGYAHANLTRQVVEPLYAIDQCSPCCFAVPINFFCRPIILSLLAFLLALVMAQCPMNTLLVAFASHGCP
jgi:hypothetical protein